MSDQKLKVLVVGLGQMGRSHAIAYHNHPGFEIVGLVNRSARPLPDKLTGYPLRQDYAAALAEFSPDVVSIATHTNTHADYAVAASGFSTKT
jgi:predicted dehydrogenase